MPPAGDTRPWAGWKAWQATPGQRAVAVAVHVGAAVCCNEAPAQGGWRAVLLTGLEGLMIHCWLRQG
jgi:hypothetical protein